MQKHLKSNKYRKLKKTRSALSNTGLRTKRVFDDVLCRQPSCRTLVSAEQSEIDYRGQERKLFDLFDRWVPPVDEKEHLIESPPGDSTTQLENVLESMWSNLLKPITQGEVHAACKHKKSAPGRTRITHRMVLYSHTRIQTAIARLLSNILSTGEVPDVFKVALLRPIPKELGKPLEEAARPIVLLECIWKILTAIVSNRLQAVIEENQLVYPAAFGFPTYSLELDVSKAYDHTRGHMLDICHA